MNLYRIWQTVNRGYDTYDSAVVVAESEEAAAQINPCGKDAKEYITRHEWTEPENVKVELIGTAIDGLSKGVVIASFNAG